MAVFDVLNPLKHITPKFTEEQLLEIVNFFDEKAKPLLIVNEEYKVNVITVEHFRNFLALKKFHKRSFHYPSYQEIMLEVENLKAGATRLITKEQFIYILNKWIIEPTIKHELKLAFRVFDTQDRNFLDIEEIEGILTAYNDPFTVEELREILRDANVRGDGNVFYEDFIESMFSRAPELYEIKAEYLYEDGDEDPSVEREPEPEPEPVVEEPPPPPPPKKKKGKKK